MAPLLSSVEDAMEAIFLTAHKEDFGQQEEVIVFFVVVIYHVTIVAIGHGLFKKFLPFW